MEKNELNKKEENQSNNNIINYLDFIRTLIKNYCLEELNLQIFIKI